jgi:hypothetical protein
MVEIWLKLVNAYEHGINIIDNAGLAARSRSAQWTAGSERGAAWSSTDAGVPFAITGTSIGLWACGGSVARLLVGDHDSNITPQGLDDLPVWAVCSDDVASRIGTKVTVGERAGVTDVGVTIGGVPSTPDVIPVFTAAVKSSDDALTTGRVVCVALAGSSTGVPCALGVNLPSTVNCNDISGTGDGV